VCAANLLSGASPLAGYGERLAKPVLVELALSISPIGETIFIGILLNPIDYRSNGDTIS